MFMSRFIRRLARTGMLAVILPVLAVPAARALTTGNLCLGNVMSINPVYPEADLTSVIFFKGTYVAVSSNGLAMYGPDGKHWTQVDIPGNPDLEALAANNSTIMAVGVGGLTYQSTNGISWTEGTVVGTLNLNDVTWTGTEWLTVGDQGTVATSPDGVTWTFAATGTDNDLLGVTFTNEIFVAVGVNSTIATSTDGVIWLTHSSGTSAISGDLESVAYDPNPGEQRLVAVGTGGEYFSINQGATWTLGTGPGAARVRWFQKPGLFITNGLSTSPDGVNWTGSTAYTNPPITDAATSVQDITVSSTGTHAIGVGIDTSIYNTPDFKTWTQLYVGAYPNLGGIGDDGNITGVATDGALGIVEVATNPGKIVGSPCLFSQDGGVTFSLGKMPAVNTNTTVTFDPQAVAYSPKFKAFVAVGNDNSVEESIDGGFTWEIELEYNQKGVTEPTFNNIIWDGVEFLAVGNTPNASDQQVSLGNVQYSPNGVTWTGTGLGTTSQNLYGIGSNGAGHVVAVGGGNVAGSVEGEVIATPDMFDGAQAAWVGEALGFAQLNSVAYGNGLWVIVGGNATAAAVYTSPDVFNPDGTLTWSVNGMDGAAANINSVIFTNGFFYAFGTDGNVYISIDSVTWLPCVGPAATGVALVKGAVSAQGLDFVDANNISYTGKAPPAPPAVTITKQPKDTAGVFNKTLTLSALGTSISGGVSFPVLYQWRLNGVDLINGGSVHGANSATLTISPLTTAFAGNYTVIVSNGLRSTTSLVAKVTVNYPPVITKQPASQHVPVGPGSELILYVTAGGGGNPPVNGTLPVTYQWYVGKFKLVNNSVVRGAKGPMLQILVVQPRRSGNYTVRVTNPYGTVTSQIAVVQMG
jgi:hypothetical protein